MVSVAPAGGTWGALGLMTTEGGTWFCRPGVVDGAEAFGAAEVPPGCG